MLKGSCNTGGVTVFGEDSGGIFGKPKTLLPAGASLPLQAIDDVHCDDDTDVLEDQTMCAIDMMMTIG